MVRLKDPLMGQKASKQLGHQLVYKTKKNKSFLTKYSKPGSVKAFTPSLSQEEKRIKYGQCVEEWRRKTQAEKEVYNNRAKGRSYSGWNLFLKECMLAPEGWVVDGYTYTTRRKLTIDHDLIDEDLVDFPVLVKLQSLPAVDFNKFNEDGHDIRFTKADGQTLLKYERERHDKVNQKGEYWVKVPNISKDADTDFYIYYRTEDTLDGEDPTNVWDNHFIAVYHLKESSGNAKDSTGNGHDGNFQGNLPMPIEGKIAKAQDLDGIGDYITMSVGTMANQTREVWVSVDAFAQYDGLVSSTSWVVGSGHFKIENSPNNCITWHINQSGADNKRRWLNLLIGVYYYAVAIYRGADGYMALYGNGDLKDSIYTQIGMTIQDVNRIGNEYNDARDINGKIDEVRISDIVRPPAYIKATYHSGNNTLLTYGNEETP